MMLWSGAYLQYTAFEETANTQTEIRVVDFSMEILKQQMGRQCQIKPA